MTASGKVGKTGGGACPVCGAPVDRRYRPFCSRRCADIDLGRWLTGAYAIPSVEEDAPEPFVAPDPETGP